MKKLLKANRLFIACFIFLIAFWTIRAVAVNYDGGNYNSDQVAQQNILKDWQAGYRAKVAVGDDNWFIKYPLYVVTNNLPTSPIKQLFITNLIIIYVTAFFLLYSVYKFIDIFVSEKKIRKKSLVLMTIFLAIIPTIAFLTIANPDSRNVEVGLTLFLLLQLHRFLFDKNWLKAHFRLKLGLLFLLLSSLIADDPLFLYSVVAPLALAALGLFIFDKLSSRHLWKLGIFTFLAFVGSRIIKLLMTSIFPLTFATHGPSVASFAQVEKNLLIFFQFGVGIFGINVWGYQLGTADFTVGLVYILVFGLACYFLSKAYKRNKNLFYGALGFIFIWTIATFFFNSIVFDALSARYLIYALPIEILGLLLAVTAIKTTKQYAALLVVFSVGFVLLFFTTAQTISRNRHNPPNAIDYQVINTLEKDGVTQGYGMYWLAGIQTYLSNNKIHELSIKCIPDSSMPTVTLSSLLSENGTYYKLHPAKSFLVYSTIYQSASCSPEQLAPLLGQPAQLLNFGGPVGDYVAIYNYNIGTKIGVQ